MHWTSFHQMPSLTRPSADVPLATRFLRCRSSGYESPSASTALVQATVMGKRRNGTLHGGCTATLVDTVGSAALVTMSLKIGARYTFRIIAASAPFSLCPTTCPLTSLGVIAFSC